MKKILGVVTLSTLVYMGYGQEKVGINTTEPKATLDVVGKPREVNILDGILAPRLTGNELKAKTYTLEQKGAMVYVTAPLNTSNQTGQVVNVKKVGQYVFDGTVWQRLTDTVGHLEEITEDGNTGYRILGRNPNNYGNIGENAVDLSYSYSGSTVFGATGSRSTAMGSRTTASGSVAVAMGSGTVASGNLSTAMGSSTTTSGVGSTAMGWRSTASGQYSVAMGNNSNASGYVSTVIGFENTASGHYSLAVGNGTTASSWASVTMGSYNTLDTKSQPTTWGFNSTRLFVLGNGIPSTKSDAFTVLRNGQVGIDIDNFERTNRGEKLQVNGAIAQNVGSSFPDYVFEQYYDGTSEINAEYNFKTLSFIESFVKKHKHLPGYPSVKDIKDADGYVSVTQTQLTNVEKIEELYLHTIEQEKKIKDQQKENKVLKQLVERQGEQLKAQQKEMEELKFLVKQLIEEKK